MNEELDKRLYGAGFLGSMRPSVTGALRRRFTVPPFSVLNARDKDWQARKRAWVRLGIRGEEGRVAPDSEDGLGVSYTCGGPGSLSQRYKRGVLHKGPTVASSEGDKWTGGRSAWQNSGTSIFDPVLCELCYGWFCTDNGSILDPFAGGSTRGVVAAAMGYQYTGVELREEQVVENRRQAERIGVKPCWVLGDSTHIDGLLPDGVQYDMVFSCPPYYDLEVYSRQNEDGSAKRTYAEFMDWYVAVFQQCVARLHNDRFLVVVVGEVRDKRGVYRNFVGDNIRCFTRHLGLLYYNEAILVTAVGSLPIRTTKQFNAGRKFGKSHQNVLVFFKGDPKRISQLYGSKL